jgi:hypothetical protein
MDTTPPLESAREVEKNMDIIPFTTIYKVDDEE